MLVWIHGGRFLFGQGGEPEFDGAALASKGLVVVTLNCRMGVFGYLAVPDLGVESGHGASGNYGLLDQMAALCWVRDDIAAFGGDPQRVTVAGQSAGGASVADMLYSPLGRGLFDRAVVESAALHPGDPAISTLAPSPRNLVQAEKDGLAYAENRGATGLADLRTLPADDLLRGSDANDTSVPGNPPPPLFRPVIDGWVLPRTYGETLTEGPPVGVPVLTGNNKDENGATPRQEVPLEQYRARAAVKYGDMAEEFLALYPAATDVAASEQTNAALRDAARVSTYLWATEYGATTSNPVFTYYWTHQPPGAQGEARGAHHGSEIAYVFANPHTVGAPYTETDRGIADTLSSYVVNFATGGDPNGPGLPAWAPVSDGSPTTFEVGAAFGRLSVADSERTDFLMRFFAAQKAW